MNDALRRAWLLTLIVMAFAFVADASDAPPKPDPAVPVPGQCVSAVGMGLGDVATCKGVLVPTSNVADFLAIEAWGDAVSNHHQISVDAATQREALLQAEIARYKNPPLLQTPQAHRWIGRVEGVIAGVAGGVLLYAWIDKR